MLTRWAIMAYAIHVANIARAAPQASNTTAPVSVITGVPTITQVTSVASPTAPLTAILPSQVPLPPQQAWCPSEIFCPGAVRRISFPLLSCLDYLSFFAFCRAYNDRL
jgi:alpha,alpha-trehalase